jgi:hypothetical protein
VRERDIVGLLAALLSFGVSQPALAQRYECKADLTVGYAFDEINRSWTAKQFHPSEQKYVIRRLTDNEMQSPIAKKGMTWGAFEGEENYTIFKCPEPKTSVNEDGLQCGGMAVNFIFDASSRRYQKYYLGGYVRGRDDNDDTPSIEIGRCKEIPNK